MTSWLPSEDHTAKALWESGRTASEIAKVNGRTRNAVIGRLSRLGCTRSDPDRRSNLRRLTGGRFHKPKAHAKPKPPKIKAQKPELVIMESQPPHYSLNLRLTELRPHMCKWPTGYTTEYTFCGAPTDGVYCQAHRRLAVVPPKQKRAA